MGLEGVNRFGKCQELVTELRGECLCGPGTGLTEGTHGAPADVVCHGFEQIHILRGALALANTGGEFQHPGVTLAAGGALAAGFPSKEAVKVVEALGHAASVIHHDNTAGAAHGAELGNAVQIHGYIKDAHLADGAVGVAVGEHLVATHNLGRCTAGDDGLELAADARATANIVQQFTIGDGAGDNLIHAGALYVAAHADDSGAGAALCALCGIGLSAHHHNLAYLAEGLHVVNNGGATIQTNGCGEVGGLNARVRAHAFNGVDKAGFLTANVCPRTAVKHNLEVETALLNVFTQVALGLCLFNGIVHDACCLRELLAHVDNCVVSLYGVAGNNHTLQQLVRVLVYDETVFEGAGLGLIAVAYQVYGLGVALGDEGPLDTGGETCTATAAQPALLNFIDDIGRLHLKHLLEGLVAAVFNETFDGRIIPLAVNVLEDAARFLRVRLSAGFVGNFAHVSQKGLLVLLFGCNLLFAGGHDFVHLLAGYLGV